MCTVAALDIGMSSRILFSASLVFCDRFELTI